MSTPYLILFSLAKPNRATAQRILDNLKRTSQTAPAPLWIDAAYVGIAVTVPSQTVARAIAAEALHGLNEQADLRDLLIIEIGPDWAARPSSKAAGWLTNHIGSSPLARGRTPDPAT